MILEKGNMWDMFGKTDLFLITTNPIINKQGKIVMGRGIAKEAATRFPDLPKRMAQQIQDWDGEYGPYPPNSDVIYGPAFDGQIMGYFHVKSHWRLPAELTIIGDSLMELVYRWQAHKYYERIDINFPGIGNGKLDREPVLKLLEEYLTSDAYHVWEYGK